MQRCFRVALLTLGLTVLVGGCADDPGGSGSTTITTGSSPIISTATTTTVSSVIEIPEQGILKLQPGTLYAAGRFWALLSFTVDQQGWWARGATEEWAHVEYHEDGESIWELDVSVIAPAPSRSPDDLVSDIVGDDQIELTSDPIGTTVAGHDARVLDVEVEGVESGDRLDSCTDREYLGNSRFYQLHAGLHLMLDTARDAIVGGWSFGVRECRAARIWVVDVDGSTIVIIAAAFDRERFEALIPAAERLLAGIDFRA